jgi:hypothetical protein
LKQYGLARQALHSYRLEIEIYWQKKIFIWDLKQDMKRIILSMKEIPFLG